MRHFKSIDGQVFAYDETQTPPENLIEISQEESALLIASAAKARFDSLSYTQKRLLEYPPMSDYLDGIVKGDQAQVDKYIADCQAVKAKYPKPVA